MLKNFEVIYFPYDTTLRKSITEYALQLKSFINNLNLTRKEKVSIFSLSAGGIIASYYTKFLDKKRVNKLVTVCSPFGGSWIRIFFRKRRGAQELGPNSILLKRLANKKNKFIKEFNLWCFLDPLVPGTSGKGDNSKHTLFFLHWVIQFWPPIILRAKDFLEED
ncbi:MAG: hypothetical protein KGH55_00400 [Nanoarchaeota archaeon]|nr:hypothetical protein [Nanoarchaeota archaeon]